MLHETIDKLIMESMKAHDEIRTKALRAIKDAFLKWKTAKENVGKTLDQAAEINVFRKMIKQRTESADLYEQAGRLDLAEAEKAEIDVIEEFIPKAATEDEIEAALGKALFVLEPVQRNMGAIIRSIKQDLPNADGALVAKIVKSHLL